MNVDIVCWYTLVFFYTYLCDIFKPSVIKQTYLLFLSAHISLQSSMRSALLCMRLQSVQGDKITRHATITFIGLRNIYNCFSHNSITKNWYFFLFLRLWHVICVFCSKFRSLNFFSITAKNIELIHILFSNSNLCFRLINLWISY